jgi:hypothetical protein
MRALHITMNAARWRTVSSSCTQMAFPGGCIVATYFEIRIGIEGVGASEG